MVNLSGEYLCVQACELRLPGPAHIPQYGWNMNLLNEAGVPSRAWIDWPGHLWAQEWNEGAIIAPDGMTIQFDRGRSGNEISANRPSTVGIDPAL
jgi:hypothetical protein